MSDSLYDEDKKDIGKIISLYCDTLTPTEDECEIQSKKGNCTLYKWLEDHCIKELDEKDYNESLREKIKPLLKEKSYQELEILLEDLIKERDYDMEPETRSDEEKDESERY